MCIRDRWKGNEVETFWWRVTGDTSQNKSEKRSSSSSPCSFSSVTLEYPYHLLVLWSSWSGDITAIIIVIGVALAFLPLFKHLWSIFSLRPSTQYPDSPSRLARKIKKCRCAGHRAAPACRPVVPGSPGSRKPEAGSWKPEAGPPPAREIYMINMGTAYLGHYTISVFFTSSNGELVIYNNLKGD